jgi:hypothetical protein
MTRFRAAGIHLILSGLIVLTLLVLMFGVWYPSQYFKLMGGDGLIYLIVGIDLCLGPLLTLVVFKSGKKSLKFDLTVIVLMQLAALAYGSNIMFTARPIFTAYADGEFSIATAKEVFDSELKLAAKPEWSTRSLTGPIIVGIAKPTDKKELKDLEFLSMGIGYARFPRLFVSYESQRNEVLKDAKPLSTLRTFDKKNNLVIEQLLKDENRPEKDFVFVPIGSFFEDRAAILDANTAKFITIIDARPRAPIKKATPKVITNK